MASGSAEALPPALRNWYVRLRRAPVGFSPLAPATVALGSSCHDSLRRDRRRPRPRRAAARPARVRRPRRRPPTRTSSSRLPSTTTALPTSHTPKNVDQHADFSLGAELPGGSLNPAELPDETFDVDRLPRCIDLWPVIHGHHWAERHPRHRQPDHRVRHDSAGKGGDLVAYRWSAEATPSDDHFVSYPGSE
jgi:hypothetical protein